MVVKKIYFESTDNWELFGLLHLPENQKAKTVVISVHGFGSIGILHKREDTIATTLTENGIAYFCFNNRGYGFINKFKISQNGKTLKKLGGCCYENVVDSYYDVIGAIDVMLDNGFEKVILQGHSLGCSKIMLTYQRLLKEKNEKYLNKISACIFLSPVDSKAFILDKDKNYANKIYELAKEKCANGEDDCLIPDAILNTRMSANSVVSLIDNIDEINLPTETDGGNFDKFDSIKCPIFVCYGEDDYTIMPTKNLVELFKSKIKKQDAYFDIILGANHPYSGKTHELSVSILNFISKNTQN